MTYKKQDETPYDVVSAPSDIAETIDKLVERYSELKRIEIEVQNLKSSILEFAKTERARRVITGQKDRTFKISGRTSAVTFVITDGGATIETKELEPLVKTFGSNIKRLVQLDYASLKFNVPVLTPNFSQVAAAFERLPQHILGDLFLPPAYKIVKGGAQQIPEISSDIEQIKQLHDKLKTTVKLQIV